MEATYHSIISMVKLHGSSVWSYLVVNFSKKSLRNVRMLSHSYLSVSDLRSPQYPNSIEFLTKSIEVDTEKSSLFWGNLN